MIRRIDTRPQQTRALFVALPLWLAALAANDASAVVLTGEVRATEAEAIWVPPSDSSPVVLRVFAAEGSVVKAGDVLVRIDPGEALVQLESLQAQIEQGEARVAKEISDLQLKALDAEKALLDADLALAKASIDAGIPVQYLSALDADRYRGEHDRAGREQVLKRQELEAAHVAVVRRRDDARLEGDKLRAELAYNTAKVATAEQRATGAGVVVHGFDRWQGKRYDEGSSGYPGNRIGDVVGDGPMAVRAWALEPDRPALAEDAAVIVRFDALPGQVASGRIRSIAGAPEAKAEWGDGRWFTVEIDLAPNGLALLPGMSARVELAVPGEETGP